MRPPRWCELNYRAARLAARRPMSWRSAAAGRASWPAHSTHQPHDFDVTDVNDPAIAASASMSWWPPTWRRRAGCCSGRRPAADRDRVRYFERQGGDLRGFHAVRRDRHHAAARALGTITDASGRLLSGQTTEAFWNSIRHAQPLFVGLNCALGAAAATLRRGARRRRDTYVCVYPNAGLPTPSGSTTRGRPRRPTFCASMASRPGERGGRVLRHHPEHIRLLHAGLRDCAPRRLRPCR